MELNPVQRVILLLGMGVLAAGILFPPWVAEINTYMTYHSFEDLGYHFLFDAPPFPLAWRQDTRENYGFIRIDYLRWVIPLGGVILLTLGGVAITRASKPPSAQS